MGNARANLYAALLFAVISIIATYPLALNLGMVTRFEDSRMYLWSIWWFKHSLVDLHSNPFQTSHICYPNEISLYFQNRMPLMVTAAIPLSYLTGVEAAYNLLVLASFVLCGYGMFLLCRHLTGNDYAAFVGGVLFAFAPIRFHWINLGWVNNLNCQWIAFYVLYLLKSLKEGGFRNTGLAGVFLAFTALTQLEHLVYAGILTAMIIAHHITAERKFKAALKTAAGVFIVFLFASSPVLVPTLAEMYPAKYVSSPREEVILYSADAMGILIPAPDNIFLGKAAKGLYSGFTTSPYVWVSYAGFATLALAACGMLARRDRQVFFWAVAAALFFLMSLGPVVHVMGIDTGIPGPYNLVRMIPGMGAMRFVNRFTIITQMSLAVLAAFGFGELAKRWDGRRASLAAFIVVSLALAESISAADMIGGYGDLAAYSAMPSSGGIVLHLPYRSNDAMYLGLKHGLPVVNCFLPRKPIRYMEREKIEDLQPVMNRLHYPNRVKGNGTALSDYALLKRYGVGYITAEKGFYRNDTSALRSYLSVLNASVLGEDEKVVVFRLP